LPVRQAHFYLLGKRNREGTGNAGKKTNADSGTGTLHYILLWMTHSCILKKKGHEGEQRSTFMALRRIAAGLIL
jgi:hypothetical protein